MHMQNCWNFYIFQCHAPFRWDQRRIILVFVSCLNPSFQMQHFTYPLVLFHAYIRQNLEGDWTNIVSITFKSSHNKIRLFFNCLFSRVATVSSWCNRTSHIVPRCTASFDWILAKVSQELSDNTISTERSFQVLFHFVFCSPPNVKNGNQFW